MISRKIRLVGITTATVVSLFAGITFQAEAASALQGRVVAIWSKGAGKFVRSAEVDNGVLRADSKSYETNAKGRFLCFAEVGGTIAIMDVMLERYLTVSGGNLTSAVTGTPESRRFTVAHQGNNYYTIKAGNGKYVRVDGSSNLVVDGDTVTDNAIFAIVPIRTGPNVVMRAYNGWEADIYSTHPSDFPVNKVNIGMLQMTPDLYTDTQFTNMRAVWNTDNYETEFILPYTTDPAVSLTNQVDRLVDRIKRMEGLGYTFDYVILYHEILANLPGGPWSDPRICSQQELDLFRERVTFAYNAGEVKYNSYRVFTMPYQFTSNSVMGIAPYQNTPVGCDAATLAFIKQNYDGMFLELNGHDYASRAEHIDAAAAAVWCRDNGLEFGITSGGSNNKDTNYKPMYQAIFAEMEKVGFDKSWTNMHYILHHVFQPYENRLPEWVANTTTENARWLIESGMPFETPSISAIDTDGDGIPDLQEALAGTPPLDPNNATATLLASDDFSTYTDGNINGKAGSPTGFGGVWSSAGATVSGGVVTQVTGPYRSYRSFSPAPLTSSGTIYIRTKIALSTANSFSALELAPTANSDASTVRMIGGANLYVGIVTSGTGSGTIMANDGLMHEWLIELNLGTKAGKVWVDVNTASFDHLASYKTFTAPAAFQLNAINLATFFLVSGTASVAVDDFRIGTSWTAVGVTLRPPRGTVISFY